MRSVAILIGAGLVALCAFLILHVYQKKSTNIQPPQPVEAAQSLPQVPEIEIAVVEPPKQTTTTEFSPISDTAPELGKPTEPTPPSQNAPDSTFAQRIMHPYDTPPLSAATVNDHVRAATVNILCTASGNDLNPMTASGVFIRDNVILTNAHVGQYVLLQDFSPIAISCLVRGNSPAETLGTAHIVFISKTWVKEHASEILSEHPSGTGENDVALLTISPLQTAFVANTVSPDVREAVAFEGDEVLIAGYPAGFLRGLTIAQNLSLVSTIASIGKLYSFAGNTIDMFSVGGAIVAQGGSSGAPVVNAWGKVVGMITTSSDAASTSERDLRAITMSHVDRVLRLETGMSLETLNSNPNGYLTQNTNNLRSSAQLLTEIILR